MNAINHVADIKAGFRSLAKLVAPHGRMIITIDAHKNRLMKAVFRIGPGDILHPHQYDLAEYIGFIEREGLKVVQSVCLETGRIFDHYMLIAAT